MQDERDGEKPSKRALGFTKLEPGDLEPTAGHSTGVHTAVWGLQTQQTQASWTGSHGLLKAHGLLGVAVTWVYMQINAIQCCVTPQ